VRMGHEGAQRRTQASGRGGVKDPRSGPGPILEPAPHHGEAWAEPVQQGQGPDAGSDLDCL
jgi:hypothetical protein